MKGGFRNYHGLTSRRRQVSPIPHRILPPSAPLLLEDGPVDCVCYAWADHIKVCLCTCHKEIGPNKITHHRKGE
jgi:hypothetical protein